MAKPKAIKRTHAIHRPAITAPKVQMHTEDIVLPQDTIRDVAQTITGDLQSIKNNGGDVLEVFRTEAFMNQLLLITINPPGDNENPVAQVIVNNRQFDIPRGRMVRVPRYVVEALAHAKQASFKTRRTFVGDQSHMKPVESHNWSFPFGVQNDPAGMDGAKWLEKVMNDTN